MFHRFVQHIDTTIYYVMYYIILDIHISSLKRTNISKEIKFSSSYPIARTKCRLYYGDQRANKRVSHFAQSLARIKETFTTD